MKILFLANLIPYPLDGGGKIFTFSVLKSLSERHDVDVLCFYEHENINEGKAELSKYCNSIEVLPIKVTTNENMKLMMLKAGLSMFSLLPLGISKYINSNMKSLIKSKMTSEKYDCVFFNILAMYGYANFIRSINPCIKTVLYEQNCESLIYKRYLSETSSVAKKIFLSLETAKLQRFEYKSINKVDELILLSQEDKTALKINRDCSIIPIGVQASSFVKSFGGNNKEKICMLFVGTMTWAPNNEGIIWFLKNVMPLCDDSTKYELFIIGKNPSDEVKELCGKFNNVNLLGYVKSLEEFYEKCDVLIVPLFIGSGQRVKIIEAFAKGYPIISTSIGAEGLKCTNGKEVLIANTKMEFKNQIDKCRNIELLQRLGANGLSLFRKEYSTDVIGEKIDRVIRGYRND